MPLAARGGGTDGVQAVLAWKSSRWPTVSEQVTTDRSIFPSRAVPRPTPAAITSTPPPKIVVSLPPTAPALRILATDPYTSLAYQARTSLPCHSLSFADVAAGLLPPPPSLSTNQPSEEEGSEEEEYDITIISFALHLLQTNSELWSLLSLLAKRSKFLVILAPHKKPTVRPFLPPFENPE